MAFMVGAYFQLLFPFLFLVIDFPFGYWSLGFIWLLELGH